MPRLALAIRAGVKVCLCLCLLPGPWLPLLTARRTCSSPILAINPGAGKCQVFHRRINVGVQGWRAAYPDRGRCRIWRLLRYGGGKSDVRS